MNKSLKNGLCYKTYSSIKASGKVYSYDLFWEYHCKLIIFIHFYRRVYKVKNFCQQASSQNLLKDLEMETGKADGNGKMVELEWVAKMQVWIVKFEKKLHSWNLLRFKNHKSWIFIFVSTLDKDNQFPQIISYFSALCNRRHSFLERISYKVYTYYFLQATR